MFLCAEVFLHIQTLRSEFNSVKSQAEREQEERIKLEEQLRQVQNTCNYMYMYMYIKFSRIYTPIDAGGLNPKRTGKK